MIILLWVVGIPFATVRLNTYAGCCSVFYALSAVLEIRRESGSSKPTPKWKQRGFGACLSPLQVMLVGVSMDANHSTYDVPSCVEDAKD